MQNHNKSDYHNFSEGNVFIETYGCQMNLLDSEIVLALLEERGFHRTENIHDANIILINTCAVREHAQEKAITNISRFKSFKRDSTNVRIGVIGCLSKYLGETLVERLPFLDWVMGPDAYRMLPQLLSSGNGKKTQLILESGDSELYDEILPARREGINAWVTISRGCDNHCTYCVVPGARGHERHRPVSSIVDEIREAVKAGFPQVTLLGQNVNSYRSGNDDFPSLLSELTKVSGLKRIRFLTSHPKDCSERLLEIIGSGPPFCPELHLPVQSGSDSILKRMGRKYSADHYRSLVEKARELVEDLYLSTDIIVGFPGETEEQFDETASLVSDVGYDDAFVYRYSERPGTPAARLKDDIANDEKVRRLMIINNLVHESAEAHRIRSIGKTVEVMVERVSKKDKHSMTGRTRGGHVVVFPGNYAPGVELPVRITRLSGFTLLGNVLNKSAIV